MPKKPPTMEREILAKYQVEELADELETMREELELLRWFYAALELAGDPYASSSVFTMAFEMERAAGGAISALPAWRERKD